MADNDGHSFGPTCQYYQEPPIDKTTYASGITPRIRARFFYASSVPIDDPLSPIPPVQSEKTSAQAPQQPFSSRDNAALEEAWQSFQEEERAALNNGKGSRNPIEKPKAQRMVSFPKFKAGEPGSMGRNQEEENNRVVKVVAKSLSVSPPRAETFTETAPSQQISALERPYEHLPKPPTPSSSDEVQSSTGVTSDAATELKPTDPSMDVTERPRRNRWFSSEAGDGQVLLSQESDHTRDSSQPVDAGELQIGRSGLQTKPKRKLSPFKLRHREKNLHEREEPGLLESAEKDDNGLKQTVKSGIGKLSDISGRPFARAPSKRNLAKPSTDGAYDDETTESDKNSPPISSKSKFYLAFHPHSKGKEKRRSAYVPVGVSRLHLVELPKLIMKPIYWSPINDTAYVVRATWFYKDTMEPLDAETANRLEIGYETIRPFSESYMDELDACVENGAAAELKIVHKLYPAEDKTSRPPSSQADDVKEMDDVDAEPPTPLPQNRSNAAVDGRSTPSTRHFATHSVIFVNEKDAQILKPSVLPSESRNRRPLKSIRKGTAIGVPVVQGFDQQVWDKLHQVKLTAKIAQARVGGYLAQSGDATTRDRRSSCAVCDAEEKAPQVTDLVLVIHGIGQKLSERVDSFHFTHAINGLRREFNVEQAAETVKGNLRAGAGLMVLPVNWRLTVSFDDENQKPKQVSVENVYGLKDITPDTLPAVRSLISDVMLDIPYYLSHHKEKMTSAVVKEANRVYRLWCRNNPGFQEHGRVHLIAHSLGSAMAMDILSQQPTTVPKGLDFTKQEISKKMFEFDTKSLFNCGSPAGFFLLLNKANLLPRKGRNKAGMKGEDTGDIAGEAGTYGCLAVDNIYNIVHKNDPIAYQQNACVDSGYAASLVPATIPSVNVGVFTKMSASLRLTSPTASAAYESAGDSIQRQPMQSMPSSVELETHNFTREEIAEKRMYLLNDNGQIDFFLNPGGGPLEFQYINMLSAHSSYWLLQDFVKFCVLEVGREPGKDKTLPGLRAQKKREFKRATMA